MAAAHPFFYACPLGFPGGGACFFPAHLQKERSPAA
jgi:hypothetical protein